MKRKGKENAENDTMLFPIGEDGRVSIFDLCADLTDMVPAESVICDTETDTDRIRALVSSKLPEKKRSRRRRLTLTLIAAVLIVGLGIFAVGMAELLFNMEEPISEEARQEILRDDQIKKYDILIEKEKYYMENPDDLEKYKEENPSSDPVFIQAREEYEKYMLSTILELLDKYGYDTSGLEKMPLNTYNISISSEKEMEELSESYFRSHQRLLELCCDAMEDKRLTLNERVRVELQLEKGLRSLVSSYIKSNSTNLDEAISALRNDENNEPVIGIGNPGLLDSLTKTRERILDLISQTAFKIDPRDKEAVEKFRADAIADGTDHFTSFSSEELAGSVWSRLNYVIAITDKRASNEYRESDEYKLFDKTINTFSKKLEAVVPEIKKDTEKATGMPFDENTSVPTVIYRDEGNIVLKYSGTLGSFYLDWAKYFYAEKPYFEKTVQILKKYGYDTDIKFEETVSIGNTYDFEQYEKHYEVFSKVCDMIDEKYKELSTEEKSTLTIFLDCAIQHIDCDFRFLSYGNPVKTELYRVENNITKYKFSKKKYDPVREQIDEECTNTIKEHQSIYPYARRRNEKARFLLNPSPNGRWRDFSYELEWK